MPYPITRKGLSYFSLWIRGDQRSRDCIVASLSEPESSALMALEKNINNGIDVKTVLNNLELLVTPEVFTKNLPGLDSAESSRLAKKIRNEYKFERPKIAKVVKKEGFYKSSGLKGLPPEQLFSIVNRAFKENGCSIFQQCPSIKYNSIIQSFRKMGYELKPKNLQFLMHKVRKTYGINVPKGGWRNGSRSKNQEAGR